MKNVGFILYVSLLLLFSFAGKAATDPDWSCDIHAYQYDMSVYLSLQKDGVPVSGDWVVAAFCEEECRGIAELQTVKDISFYYIRVRSREESGESISFKVYDRNAGKELKALGSLLFTNLEQAGYPSRPWVLTLPTVVDPESGLEEIDETTPEIVLTGTWTQERIDKLAEKIHKGAEAGNNTLSTVNMSEVVLEGGISLEGLFSNCSSLTSVILPDLSGMEPISQGVFEGVNPNCLVFVADGQSVPEAWHEQVNVVIGEKIEQLVLVEDKPFHSPLPFYAERAIYRRKFTDNRPAGSMRATGWETICLPFIVETVEFEGKQLTLVGSLEETATGDFHIATLTDRGFELLSGNSGAYMEANTPYVLNMISTDGTAIEGEVSFVANRGVRISATQPYYIQGNAQQNLTGVYNSVVPGKGIYVMNEAGDAFIENSMTVNPFEAYLQSQTASSSSIPFVLFVPVSGVQLSFNSASVKVGKTVALTAKVTPENATRPDVIWSSSDTRVATVSSSGIVTGVKAGTATIMVQTEDGSFTAICTITVTANDNPDPTPDPTPDPDPTPTPDPDDPNKPTANESMESMVIQVYPTRVTDYVHVGILPAKTRLILFNVVGKMVKQVAACEGDVDMYMGDQPSGIYLLHIWGGERHRQTVKLIKK